MNNKKLSKHILLKKINAHLKNSIAGGVIIVVLLTIKFKKRICHTSAGGNGKTGRRRNF